MIEFDNNDALMWYASLLKYIYKDDLNFADYEQHIPANLIRLPQQEGTNQAIPDMTSTIKYTRERAEFDDNAIEEEIDNK